MSKVADIAHSQITPLHEIAGQITGLDDALQPFSPFSRTPAATTLRSYIKGSGRVLVILGGAGSGKDAFAYSVADDLAKLKSTSFSVIMVRCQDDISHIRRMMNENSGSTFIVSGPEQGAARLDYSAIDHNSMTIALTEDHALESLVIKVGGMAY